MYGEDKFMHKKYQNLKKKKNILQGGRTKIRKQTQSRKH